MERSSPKTTPVLAIREMCLHSQRVEVLIIELVIDWLFAWRSSTTFIQTSTLIITPSIFQAFRHFAPELAANATFQAQRDRTQRECRIVHEIHLLVKIVERLGRRVFVFPRRYLFAATPLEPKLARFIWAIGQEIGLRQFDGSSCGSHLKR